MPDNKDVIPLNFLQHLHLTISNMHVHILVENLYVHKTKSLATTQVKRKHGRPPKAKPENLNSNPNCITAATTCTMYTLQNYKISSNDIASRN